jgi:hypothetical protein
VEVVQREPLHRGVDQVGKRKERCGAFGAQVLAREPEHRKGAERDGHGLNDEEHRGARPDPPERSEGGEQRIDVGAETVDLVAVQLGDVEWSSMRRRPHGLHHVS